MGEQNISNAISLLRATLEAHDINIAAISLQTVEDGLSLKVAMWDALKFEDRAITAPSNQMKIDGVVIEWPYRHRDQRRKATP